MNATTLALEALHQRYRNLWQRERHQPPTALFDRAWPSPCIIETIDHETAHTAYTWQATARDNDKLFNEMEAALETTFHPDVHAFYASFWADSIPIEHPEVDALLLQIWNEEDATRLQENLLGHAFARLKGRLPLTLFIGCTHGNDMVCIDNSSGQIVLEKPGYAAHKTLADSLEEWLLACTPCFDEYA